MTQREAAAESVEREIRSRLELAEWALRDNPTGYGLAYRRERLRLWRLALAAVGRTA